MCLYVFVILENSIVICIQINGYKLLSITKFASDVSIYRISFIEEIVGIELQPTEHSDVIVMADTSSQALHKHCENLVSGNTKWYNKDI